MTDTSILAEFDEEMANPRKILERVPEEKFDWSPHPKSKSLGTLANHLAAMPTIATAIAERVAKKMPETTSRAELLATFDFQLRDRAGSSGRCQ